MTPAVPVSFMCVRSGWATCGESPKGHARSTPDSCLGGRVKSRNLSTVQIPHFPAATETREFYFVASSVRKSVCTFVCQLRGPHLSTWA